jgi:hypothetical protein
MLLQYLSIQYARRVNQKKISMKKEKKNKPALQNSYVEIDARLLEKEIWLTTEQAMEHLNVSRSTIFRWRTLQYIPNFKLGRIPMFPKHLLNKLLMKRSLSNLKKE